MTFTYNEYEPFILEFKKAPVIESSKRYIGLMRHSKRLDVAIETPSLTECQSLEEQAVEQWEKDKVTRPYDPPICDFELPKIQAQRIMQFNFSKIITSPFRRCLQTAAVVANTLNIRTIEINKTIGEKMSEIKSVNGQYIDVEYLGEKTDTSDEQMKEIIKGKKTDAIITVVGDKPNKCNNDSIKEHEKRYENYIDDFLKPDKLKGNVLIVTHGDFLDVFYKKILKQDIYECGYCGYSVLSRDGTNFNEEIKDSISIIEE